MTQEQWGIFITGVGIGLIFCGSFVMGAMWMFKTVMKLQACGFKILDWHTVHYDPAHPLGLRQQSNVEDDND